MHHHVLSASHVVPDIHDPILSLSACPPIHSIHAYHPSTPVLPAPRLPPNCSHTQTSHMPPNTNPISPTTNLKRARRPKMSVPPQPARRNLDPILILEALNDAVLAIADLPTRRGEQSYVESRSHGPGRTAERGSFVGGELEGDEGRGCRVGEKGCHSLGPARADVRG